MIRFFRRIRQGLLSDSPERPPDHIRAGTRSVWAGSKFTRCMLYALGEIILVVIGILIALQIDMANQNRLNNKTELYYLDQMKRDLLADSLFRHQEKLNFENSLPIIQNFLYELHKDNNRDSFNKTIRAYLNDVMHPISFVSNNVTYNEMKSSAKLGIIRDNDLRNRIVTQYNHLEDTKNIYTTNYEFMNAIDVVLISQHGLAKFQKKQSALFDAYNTEDELYALKGIKDELESNTANWHWSIIDLLPVIVSQLAEIKDVMSSIEGYVEHKGE